MKILAVHGFGLGNDHGWPRVAQAAPQLDWVMPLMAGRREQGPDPGVGGVREQARRMLAALEGERDVLVVGHSVGGPVAIRAAESLRPRALVLIEPNLVCGGGFVTSSANALGPHPSQEALASFRTRFNHADTGEGMFGDLMSRWHWAPLHALAHEMIVGDSDPGWEDTLTSLKCPIHFVWGEKSGPEDHVDVARVRSKGYPVHVVAGAGHFVPSEAPERLAAIVADIAKAT